MIAPAVSPEHWQALVAKLRAQAATPPTCPLSRESPLIDWCVYSLLLWETTSPTATAAFERTRRHFVDYNDLRVSTKGEITAALGEKYPLAAERAIRLHALLCDIFERENSLNIERLRSLHKRDARAYLLSLEGCPEPVASMTFASGLSGHAIPVDQRLQSLLIRADVAAADTTPSDIAAWLVNPTPAEEAPAVTSLLRAWSDSHTRALRGGTPKTPAHPTGRPRKNPAKGSKT